VHAHVRFFHHQARPHLAQQFILAHHLAGAPYQAHQQVEGARAQRHFAPAGFQPAPAREQHAWSDAPTCVHCRSPA
jgi:hypothetical protein